MNLEDTAKSLDKQFGNVEGFASKLGVDELYNESKAILKSVSPTAADVVDKVFGAAKIALDKDGSGTIEFSEVAKTLTDASKTAGDLAKGASMLGDSTKIGDMAKTVGDMLGLFGKPSEKLSETGLRVALMKALIGAQLEMFNKAWDGDRSSSGSGGDLSPFLAPLKTGILTTLKYVGLKGLKS